MKVSIIVFLVSCIIILSYISETMTLIDVFIFVCVSYISNKTFVLIGEYIKIKKEQHRFELILQKIEKNLECHSTQ